VVHAMILHWFQNAICTWCIYWFIRI
jgi:hypothetical protein